MARKIPKYEFKPDPTGSDLSKMLYLTPRQRRILAKWVLYFLLVVVALVAQDTLLGRIRICGATTDLAVCAIMLIGVLEGAENGGTFALVSGIFYFFSGSAPGPYVIVLITAATIGAAMFRQGYWSQGLSTAVLCTGLGMMAYELALLVIGKFMNLTNWNRMGVFALTAVLSAAAVFPLYPLMRGIGNIGGEAWKE